MFIYEQGYIEADEMFIYERGYIEGYVDSFVKNIKFWGEKHNVDRKAFETRLYAVICPLFIRIITHSHVVGAKYRQKSVNKTKFKQV